MDNMEAGRRLGELAAKDAVVLYYYRLMTRAYHPEEVTEIWVKLVEHLVLNKEILRNQVIDLTNGSTHSSYIIPVDKEQPCD